MKKLLIKAAIRLLGNWINAKAKKEKIRVLYLYIVHAVEEIVEILTDKNQDDSEQLEQYAIEKLPETITIFESFLLPKEDDNEQVD